MKKRVICFLLAWISLIATLGAVEPSKALMEKKIIYLTFDDGPSEYTQKLLDVLKAYEMKATFFLLEPEMKRNPKMVKRIYEEGHAIGVHGVSHEKDKFYCGKCGPLRELEAANNALQEIIGQKTVLARTPYGSKPYLSKSQQELLDEHHYVLWDWNIDSKDWCYRNAQKTYSSTIKMISQCSNEPKVILLHDIKQAGPTMELLLSWMAKNDYVSEAITTDLLPVKLKYYKK